MNLQIASIIVLIFTAKDIIQGLLMTDPSHRLTIAQVMNHPWIKVRISYRIHTETVTAALYKKITFNQSFTLDLQD